MTANPTEKALFSIDYDGRWFHDGAEIRRKALAKLFSDKGLRIDDQGQYWLSSPEERYPVSVADVPFIVVDYDIRDSGPAQEVDLKTNMEEIVPLGPDHSFELRPEPLGGMIVPYIEIRKGLYARLSRSVYYNLIEQAASGRDMITLRSRGTDQVLGRISHSEIT